MLAAIQAGDYYQVGQLFAQKINDSLEAINWAPIQEKAARWASNLATALNGFVEDPKIWQNLGHTLAQGLNTALIFIDDFVQQFHWISLGQGCLLYTSRCV